MSATRKSLHFDLNSAKLIEACSNSENNIQSRTDAYKQTAKFLTEHGFEHRQGSGYTTIEGMSRPAVERAVNKMVDKFPWFADCVEKIDVTFVGKTFDLLPTVRKELERDKDFGKDDILARKAVNFDLDNSALKIWYTKEDGTPKAHTAAYADIRSFLQKNGFEPRQGSGYLSPQKMSDSQISKIVESMADQMPWLAKCARSIDVTNVTRSFDLMQAVQKRRQQQIYEKISNISTKGDAVLAKGHPDVLLNEIPKEEWPYIADVRNGTIIIDDKEMERDGYSFDWNGDIVRNESDLDKDADRNDLARDWLAAVSRSSDEHDESWNIDEYCR